MDPVNETIAPFNVTNFGERDTFPSSSQGFLCREGNYSAIGSNIPYLVSVVSITILPLALRAFFIFIPNQYPFRLMPSRH